MAEQLHWRQSHRTDRMKHASSSSQHFAASSSRPTLHAEMLRLCARIGYSPHASL